MVSDARRAITSVVESAERDLEVIAFLAEIQRMLESLVAQRAKEKQKEAEAAAAAAIAA